MPIYRVIKEDSDINALSIGLYMEDSNEYFDENSINLKMKNGGNLKFDYRVNEDNAQKHSLRLKLFRKNSCLMSLNIDTKTGYPTIDKSRVNGELTLQKAKDYATIAGAFSIFAIDPLNKAFGHRNLSTRSYIKGDSRAINEVEEKMDEFNRMSKNDKSIYLNKSKANLKIK